MMIGPYYENCWNCRFCIDQGRRCDALTRTHKEDPATWKEIKAWINENHNDLEVMPRHDSDGCPAWVRGDD